MRIREYLDRLKSIDLRRAAVEALITTNEVRADLQAAQLFAGLTSTGDRIQPEYRPLTVLYKKGKNQPSDRVTLRDTGAFYAGIYSRVQGINVVMYSSDPKAQELVGKYGVSIFGLSPEYRKDYIVQFLYLDFLDQVRRQFSK